MKVVTVTCNHCGAPLEVGAKTRFVTCAFCDARLEVKRSDSAIYTDVVEAVGELRAEVKSLRVQSEIAELDRDWDRTRERFMIQGKHGARHLPSQAGGVAAMVVGIVGGIAFFVFASSVAPGIGMVGLVFAAVGVIMGLRTMSKARQLDQARRRYRAKRRGLQQQVAER